MKGIIKPTFNGPYIVKEIDMFKNSKGRDMKKQATMYLCRCGGSSNKPFCDGTHIKNGFVGDKNPDRVANKVDVYSGNHITIYDNRGICAHRGYCSEELPGVFGSDEPWINPDGASVEEIIRICQRCPSGALTYALPGGERQLDVEEHHAGLKLSPRRFDYDGPYDITGAVIFEDDDDNQPESTEHYTLCRCGASKNKPFCSGEHWHVKFIDANNK